MFSDMTVAIEDLRSVEFVLTLHNGHQGTEDGEFESSDGSIPLPRVSGSRSNLKVTLPVPDAVFAMLPMGNSLTNNLSFVVTPIFFNIGVNEVASFAERFKSSEAQEKSNLENYARLLEYHRRFKSLHLPVKLKASKRKTERGF